MNRARVHLILLLLCITLGVEETWSCGAGTNRYRTRRPLKAMILKQRHPDLQEVSKGASGASTGRITRNSSRFKQLYRNLNTDIIFKDEERTGADRYMTLKCMKCLDELGRKVKITWPGLKLRVLEAWDEDYDHHADDSLHYEGRAVDISTSDRDRSKYGMLGKLAVEAGFDWVYFESRSHIHASVRQDSDDSEEPDGCFSGNSSVRLQDGRALKMRDLRVGDKVASSDENGSVVYSEILLFMDYQRDNNKLYYVIETENPKARISLTPNHLIYCSDSNLTKSSPSIRHARFLRRSQFLYVEHEGKLVLAKVISISAEFLEGAFAPLTKQGNILVDSVLSSCYSLVKDHDLAQTVFAPLRLLHSLTPSFLLDSTNQKGFHWLSHILYQLNNILSVIGIDFL